MSETAAVETPTTDAPGQHDAATDEPLGEGGKKALAAERDARKAAEKSAAELTARLREIEAAQMSDLERAQSAAKEYEAAAAKASAEALRWRIAARHGISDDDAETFLTGTDEDTLTRQAERLAALSTAAPATPKPDRSQGAKGTTQPASTADQFAAAIEQAFTH